MTIYQLARAFLSIKSMTVRKLQNLCYFAQAWYLALNGERLVDATFIAWKHGALNKKLSACYRYYGICNIPKRKNTSELPKELTVFAKKVFKVYGKYSGDELANIIRQEEPWIEARNGIPLWEDTENIINEETMKRYYGAR